ncbi:MAG: ABC-F family ATP-binding cassette domain-containing protein [Desulfobacterales bacterium]|nr:ABC-F family ATP-binding cassette domain-containing protein [Desulfobacterales bacterium]MDD4392064.1 ABC-F family ATP-binding cassette domain-containing protein [Desulfobacterales bacterium]
MINIENLTKSYGSQVLFENISFKVNSQERIGLVGRNGHGKTTLFRIITGEEIYDSGTISIPKRYRIGYLPQQLGFTEDTVLKEGMKGLPESEKDHCWKVEKILAGLGFSAEDMQCPPGQFSGGFQVRLNLVKVLVSEPDLLLLDEPTNYLDIMSIRWIEGFLNSWPRELILISHDRSFVDKVVTHTVGIHRKKVRKITGDTGKYYSQIALDEEIYEKTRVNDQRREKEITQFVTRFRAKARLATMVQSRIKTLEKMDRQDKLERIKALDYSFRCVPYAGKNALSIRNVTFSYEPDQPVIDNLSMSIGNRDRVCIIGKNGKGKTTLLKLIAGMLPLQEGEIVFNPNIKMGVFEQTNVETLDRNRTIEDEILYSHEDVDRQQARNVCGAMMFEGDAALKKIQVLSGGEKSRVMLGKLLITPLNLLLLDEPTNHFDMESCDALLAAIDNFDGTVIMVTHNEMFLQAIAERLIVFQGSRIDVFEGNYQQFLEKCGWEEEITDTRSREKAADQTETMKLSRKEMRRRRSEIIGERSRILKPFGQRIEKAEKGIEASEEKLDKLNAAMVEASQAQDGKKIASLSRDMHRYQADIERLFDELEKSTELYETEKKQYDVLLDQLDRELE